MIFLAFRYLLERRRQTCFTLLGVFLGTTAYVAVSGFFLGFQRYLVEQLVNNTAQVRVAAREDVLTPHGLDADFFGREARVFWSLPPSGIKGYLTVQDPQSWYARLRGDPRVEAFSPLQTVPAVFRLRGFTAAATLLGCDPVQQAKVTSIDDYVTAGRFSDLAIGGNRLVLGSELARRLGAAVGSIVLVSAGTGEPTPFKVTGLYSLGNRDADSNAWTLLGDAQRLGGTPNQVNRVVVRLRDYWQAADVATTWAGLAPERSESWDQLFVSFLSMFRIQNALRYSMTFAILVVAGFGIYNVLNVTVAQKRQDIAILRSMGYDTFDVVALFFSQGLILGLGGSAAGLASGYALCRWLQTVDFSGGPFPQGHLHVSLAPAIYVQACLLALGAASFASVFPAAAAGRLTPIEIIRAGG